MRFPAPILALVLGCLATGCAARPPPAAAPGEATPPRGEPPLGGGALRADLFGADAIFRAPLIGDGGSRPADPIAGAVVAQIAGACAEGPACDAAVLLGDNFYGLGVHGLVHPEGPMMRRRFHQRYAALPIPFYAVLGNHEYLSARPLAPVWHTYRHPDELSVRDRVEVGPRGPVWVQPWRYFAVRDGDLELLFLDTTALVGADPLPELRARQLAWLDTHCAASTAKVRVAFGHHPAATYGKYRDRPDELLSDETMDVLVACGVRTYASGHDHHLQRIELRSDAGDTFLQVVSGKGGQVREAYPFADLDTRAAPALKMWGGATWTAALLPDHTGDAASNAYGGWADLRVSRDAPEVTVTLEQVEPGR